MTDPIANLEALHAAARPTIGRYVDDSDLAFYDEAHARMPAILRALKAARESVDLNLTTSPAIRDARERELRAALAALTPTETTK
jgi:hypothetical protein